MPTTRPPTRYQLLISLCPGRSGTVYCIRELGFRTRRTSGDSACAWPLGLGLCLLIRKLGSCQLLGQRPAHSKSSVMTAVKGSGRKRRPRGQGLLELGPGATPVHSDPGPPPPAGLPDTPPLWSSLGRSGPATSSKTQRPLGPELTSLDTSLRNGRPWGTGSSSTWPPTGTGGDHLHLSRCPEVASAGAVDPVGSPWASSKSHSQISRGLESVGLGPSGSSHCSGSPAVPLQPRGPPAPAHQPA